MMHFSWPHLERRYPAASAQQIVSHARDFTTDRAGGELFRTLVAQSLDDAHETMESIAAIGSEEARLQMARQAGRLDILRLLSDEALGLAEAMEHMGTDD